MVNHIHSLADVALLRCLVRSGVLSPEIARDAEAELGVEGQTGVVDWIIAKRLLGEDELARAIAKATRHTYVNLPALALDPGAVSLLKEETAVSHRVVPLRAPEGGLVVAIANPFNRDGLHAVEFATGRRVHAEVASCVAIHDAIEHAYHLDSALDAYLQRVKDDSETAVTELPEVAYDIKKLIQGSELPPVVKLLNLLLAEGIRSRASDIHIEADVGLVRIRYRVDGILNEAFRLPKWVHDPLIARCKVLARLDITERRVPQDGRINIRYSNKLVDLRVSSLPTQFGEKLTMRILDPSGTPSNLDWLGLLTRQMEQVRSAIKRPEGMVLVTGPTGSGKTTTLYSMIAEIVSSEKNIVTIENPIEYQMRGINQVEINERQGLTFAGTLRSILRQDPDVILVGEIRDQETAEIAVRAAQTGHLVFSTLHTNDAVSTIARVLDLGIEPFMLAASLNLIVAQRLVRRTCERCSGPYTPDPEALERAHLTADGHVFERGRGCQACRETGFNGRLGVYEILPISPKMRKLIETRATDSAMRMQARADGMVTLPEHAGTRLLANVTTIDEVMRVIDLGEDTLHCPACRTPVEETFNVCPGCKTALRTRCAACGDQMQPGWQVCPHCASPASSVGLVSTIAAPATRRSAVPAPPTASAPAQHYAALVVDDQPDMRLLVTSALERSGLPVSVTTASSGAEALERVQRELPDLVILDVMMPEMDGFAVCEALRANVRTAFIPILMLTALDDADSRTHGFLAGTDDYLSKPFSRVELSARVRRLLQRSYGMTATPLPSPTARVASRMAASA